MCGSSASNGYGSGGTVNATGCPPILDLSKLVVTVLACKRPDTEDATALPVPNIPALTMPPLTKVRRFIECSCGAGVGASDAMDYNAISRGVVLAIPYCDTGRTPVKILGRLLDA